MNVINQIHTGEINYSNPLFMLAVYAPAIAGVLLVLWHFGLRLYRDTMFKRGSGATSILYAEHTDSDALPAPAATPLAGAPR